MIDRKPTLVILEISQNVIFLFDPGVQMILGEKNAREHDKPIIRRQSHIFLRHAVIEAKWIYRDSDPIWRKNYLSSKGKPQMQSAEDQIKSNRRI